MPQNKTRRWLRMNCREEKSLSLFEDFLTSDPMKTGIIPRLPMQAISQLARSNRTNYLFFKPQFDYEAACKLLQLTQQAEWLKAKKMIEANPDLMFIVVKTHSQAEEISPLQYAYRVHDSYLINVFLDAIKTDTIKIQHFAEAVAAQKDILNLTPLFEAYQHYIDSVEQWLKNQSTESDVDQAWLYLGKMQYTCLPTYMLKEFCREGDNWHPTSSFDSSSQSTSVKIYEHFTGDELTLLPLNSSQPELGNVLALARGEERNGGFVRSGMGAQMALENIKYDLTVFLRLYEINLAKTKALTQQALLSTRTELRIKT